MFNKDDGFNYFKAYAKQAGYAHELACNLASSLDSGDFGSRELVDSLHTVENDADEVCHQIHARLLTDFVVPYERGSMATLANAIDDVCDAIEDTTGRTMAALVAKSAGSLKEAVELMDSRLNRFEEVKRHLVASQDAECECDRVYIEAVRELYGKSNVDGEARRIAHSMLSAIEKSSDAIEGAAECLETILIENT